MTSRRFALRQLTGSLHLIARAWRAAADQALAETGVSESLAFPLVMMNRLGSAVTQTALAAALGIEGPSLVRLLDRLEAAGLVERRGAAGDRRAKSLHLTKAGLEAAERVERLLDSMRLTLLAGTADADIEATLRVLGVIAQATGASLILPASEAKAA